MTEKQRRRAAWREGVLTRDGHRCVVCGRSDVKLDAHHITDRHDSPEGGYILANGITLCDILGGCHWKAEQFHRTGVAEPGYSPEELQALIALPLPKKNAARGINP